MDTAQPPTAVEIVTTGPAGEMRQLARALVQERLAACVHMMPISSCYTWENKIEEGDELRLAIHAPADLIRDVHDRVRELHPYQVPAFFALPMIEVGDDYLAWMVAETGSRT